MRLREFYYTLKPLIPRPLQIALRRQVASRKLKSVGHIWPIDPEASKAPQGWKGWPAHKKFALVLSHDVDTAMGLDNCLRLMELEEQLGFRSSFNFVPETYGVPAELRRTLKSRGFDVGVHGLVHDDKLFRSREVFERRAPRINNYLREWKAAGFHSPSMIRNLDWIGELDIEYDGSTFDTDPFEPQPDGVRTIFPFVVHRNSGQPPRTADRRPQTADKKISEDPTPGCSAFQHSSLPASQPPSLPASLLRSFYIELPYTLPQDHCLYVILKEKDIRIWKQKLDWVAEKGGMALLNTHPDYMNFETGTSSGEAYPVTRYVEFLEYVKKRYEGEYWHVLSREVARFWSENLLQRTENHEPRIR
jgi:hypothetical protein